MEFTFMLIVLVAMLQAFLVAGQWQMIQRNAGIAAMHTALTHYDQALMLDRTNTGPSNIRLPGGRCRKQPAERISKTDCYAHSVSLNPGNGAVRALYIYTDTWCSSGQFMANGVMVQTGGDFEGNRKIRTFTPCGVGGNCDWVETNVALARGRWYSTNQILPGGTRQIVIGGRNEPTYEFVPKRRAGEGAYGLGVLNQPGDNLYPYVFLLVSGDLFVFARNSAVVFNYNTGRVVKKLPDIPGNPRNYPSAGSAAMLPVKAPYNANEIIICGGAAAGAAKSGNTGAAASVSCGRIMPTAGRPGWAMENMPIRRVMGEMLNLPNGEMIIINGAQNGFQGWGKANNPALNPVLYNGDAAPGRRFQVLARTGIPRMYHSTANLLSDGRVMVAGSNSHQFYTYNGAFPTELRVEAFSPPYLAAGFNAIRPRITGYPRAFGYGARFVVTFVVAKRQGGVEVNILSAPYSTHSYSQGQRIVKLATAAPVRAGGGWSVQATGPPSPNCGPQQYYMMFVVQYGIPSRGVWIKLG